MSIHKKKIKKGGRRNRFQLREADEKKTETYDKLYPIKKINTKRKPVYWWKKELSTLRQECMKERRRATRDMRQANDGKQREEIYSSYKKLKKELREEIEKAKEEKWKELVSNKVNRGIKSLQKN